VSKMTSACKHRDRASGPRIPASYGTFPTVICKKCLRWSVSPVVGNTQWKPPRQLVAALTMMESDRS
jgi:hypothetical protein